MIIFHALYDAVYLCSFDIGWYEGKAGALWELLICSAFIILSGFCMNLSNRPYKRGLTVFAAGAIVSLVTFIFIPDEIIIFGVLTFLGSAMLFTALIKPALERLNPIFLLIFSFALFVLTKDVNNGFLGLCGIKLINLPDFLYNGYLLTFLGFTDKSFYSSDYFSFLPWIFLYISGFALGRAVKIKEITNNPENRNKLVSLKIPVLTFIGQRALLVYLIHQPILYLFVILINK